MDVRKQWINIYHWPYAAEAEGLAIKSQKVKVKQSFSEREIRSFLLHPCKSCTCNSDSATRVIALVALVEKMGTVLLIYWTVVPLEIEQR